MTLPHSRSTGALTAALLTCWAALGQAEQQPGTNVPTPNPAPENAPAMSTMTSPVLQEPVIEPRTQTSSIPNRPLLVTGAVLLGTSYGASAIVAGVSDRDSDDELYYPVVGPWMSLRDRDCDRDPCGRETLGTVLLIGSGVVQGLGALSMVMSLFVPERTTQEWYLIGTEHEPSLALTPVMAGDQVGAVA